MKKLFVYGAEVLKDKDDNDYVLLSLLAEEDGVMASGMYSKAILRMPRLVQASCTNK